MDQPPLTLPQLRRRVLLIGLPFAGGAALVLRILADVSLPLGIAGLAVLGGSVAAYVLSRMDSGQRRAIFRRAGIGAIAGLTGTIAYDLARYGTVALFQMSFKPFHVMNVFGELFIGSGHTESATFAAGFLYHLSNGTFFGLAYTLVFRRPQWWTGALWGIGLELCMVSLYPRWLAIQQMNEFLEVSALGHVVYGATLGLVAAAGVRRTSQAGGPA